MAKYKLDGFMVMHLVAVVDADSKSGAISDADKTLRLPELFTDKDAKGVWALVGFDGDRFSDIEAEELP